MNTLDEYLKQHGTTRYKIAQVTGISTTTLQRSSKRNAEDMNPRIMVAIAKVMDKTPGQVFDELIQLENDIKSS